jgi:hypothetical protein
MKPPIFLTLVSIVFGLSGLALLLSPGECMAVLGVTLDASGKLACRIAGQAYVGLAVALWFAREADVSGVLAPATKGVVYGGCVVNIIGTIVLVWAAVTGIVGPAGWAVAAVQAALAAGFVYTAESKRTVAASSA